MDLTAIRQLLCEALRRCGRNAEPCGERILLKAGQFVGRRFEFEGATAVWLFDDREIRFFNPVGKLLLTVPLDEGQKQESQVALPAYLP